MDTDIKAVFRHHVDEQAARHFIQSTALLAPNKIEHLVGKLTNGGAPIEPSKPNDTHIDTESRVLSQLSQNGFIELKIAADSPPLTLCPSSEAFSLHDNIDLSAKTWSVSRFTYMHQQEGKMILRSAQAHCYLEVNSPELMALLFQFTQPIDKTKLNYPDALKAYQSDIFFMLVKAKVIHPHTDDDSHATPENTVEQQWDFHDLVFHTSSRVGRSDKPIGGTYRFKGKLAPQPPVKSHTWTDDVVHLPWADVASLCYTDMPLTQALETRKSTRTHSIIPLTLQQLGEFLFRTARNRHYYDSDGFGQFTSRPYPSGGASYELEIYVTINACTGIKRGFYYYDPHHHALCLVKSPCNEMEMLLHDAYVATALQCRPQILFTFASRFNRVNWKYQGMAYATQLKNVGVLYQTMYLVATAMNIGACGLGTGNAERFRQLTQLDYMEEGSIGEFMLGRPL
ncbi:SagB family peptide dehydrogenase [Aestuariibacter sp. AA17]|uniref:SagB family peptide dehydrogenase n=1 Tax=Fluctibacter corallii TaxID=2984329 RepID=A0ABT3A4F8_9ALTE|nr:SagB family peptide dehydrogenase [Aestuariibacter sp. AA17]MCV2883419.1 SagB family peptide dehydrogenase [Aestuariibacter sp. AA17]